MKRQKATTSAGGVRKIAQRKKLTDITSSRLPGEGNLWSMEELAALNTIGLQANSSLSTDEILAQIVREFVKTLRIAHAFIFLREGENLLLKASHAAEGKALLENIPEHRVGECLCGLAVTEGRSLYSRDIFTDARCTREECKQAGLRSFAALPLWDGEEIIGVLGLASQEERDFEKQAAFLETLAGQISLGLRNARLYERIRGELTERRHIEEELRESEERFRRLSQVTFEGIVIHDGKRVLDVNPAVISMFGYELSEVIGEEILKFVAPESRELIIKSITAHNEKPTEALGLRKDGSVFPLEVVGKALSRRSTLRATALRDITERKQAQEALRESEEKYRTLVESANDGITIIQDGIVKFVNQLLAEMWGGKVEDVLETPFINYIHPDEVPAMKERYQRRLAGENVPSIYQTVLMRRDRSIVWSEIKASLITYHGSPADLIMVRDITERKQAEVDLQRHLKELTVLHEVAGAAAQAVGVDELLERVTQAISESLFPNNCGVLLYEEVGNVLHHHSSYRGGNEKKSPNMRIPLGKGVTGSVAASRKPARISDVQSISNYLNVDVASRSELCVPIMMGERLLGVLNVESVKLDAFTESDENLLVTIARTLATAFEKLRLFEETSRRLEHVQALHRIDMAISNSLDLDLTFNIFLEQVIQQLGVHAADILVLQPYTQTLQYLSGRGFQTTALQHTQLHLGQGFAGLAGQERRTIYIPDLHKHKTGFLSSPDFRYEDFDTYYGVPLIAKGQLKGVMEVFQRGSLERDPEWLDFLETLAGEAAIAIDNVTLFNDLQRANFDLRMAYDATIEGWSRALDLRDEKTEGHAQRVAELTTKLAQDMGMSATEQVNVRRGTLLHDIGKMAVPDHILRKPSPLTDEEWVIMRKHPLLAYKMLSPISYLHAALDIPYCHHERWDGSGYPRGLKGEQIPLAARIFAVVDVYDALTSERPYRKAWSKNKTLAYVREKAGQFFDPNVVDVFLREVETGKRNLTSSAA